MKWKIVLVPFPFTNLTAAKLRPALVIYESERDVVVAFISLGLTQLGQECRQDELDKPVWPPE